MMTQEDSPPINNDTFSDGITRMEKTYGAYSRHANGTVGGAGVACGNSLHHAGGLLHGSFQMVADIKYCNYAIYWGVHSGHGTGVASMASARLVAEAMERGMKLVVFDPVCRYSGGKATEWIPIVPGLTALLPSPCPM